MSDPRALVLSWLRTLTRRASDSVVTIPVSELLEIEQELLDAKPSKLKGKGSRGPRAPKGMTSRSKQRKRPDTPYLEFVRNQPCCACGGTRNVEAHHHGSKSQKGMGMKTPDHQAVPLCDRCHKHEGFHRWGTLPGMDRPATNELFARVRDRLRKLWELHEKDTF